MIELRPGVRTLAMAGFYVLTACGSPTPAAQTDSVQVAAVNVTVRPDPVYITGVEGLPSYFSGFRRVLGSGTVTVERGQVDTGDLVESP